MRLIMLEHAAFPDAIYSPSRRRAQVIEVPDARARALIAGGYAQAADGEDSPPASTRPAGGGGGRRKGSEG